MKTIEEIIAAGREKIDSKAAEKAKLDALWKSYSIAQERDLTHSTLILIPDALRPFARIVDAKILEIDPPGCARVTCELSVDMSRTWHDELKDWVSKFIDVDLKLRKPDEGWSIRKWEAYQDDGDWMVWAFRVDHPFIDDIETALALAAEIGDNFVQAEAEVHEKNIARSLTREAEPTEDKTVLTCPLMCGECLREKCALWVPYQQCSIKMLAENLSALGG